MIHFVGAGPGAEDLITLRGKRLIEGADVIIYAGSLVNAGLLKKSKPECEVYDSSKMTLEQVVSVMSLASKEGKEVVRLHTGDPSIYGAYREQMDALRELGIKFSICPGVPSFCAAAAALEAEYTLPGVSQTVILTRIGGRTPVPDEESVEQLAVHGSTMVFFLSVSEAEKVSEKLIKGGIKPETPAAIVYKASWPEERVIRTTVEGMGLAAKLNGITKTALITVGEFLGDEYDRSRLYDPGFTTGYRKAEE